MLHGCDVVPCEWLRVDGWSRRAFGCGETGLLGKWKRPGNRAFFGLYFYCSGFGEIVGQGSPEWDRDWCGRGAWKRLLRPCSCTGPDATSATRRKLCPGRLSSGLTSARRTGPTPFLVRGTGSGEIESLRLPTPRTKTCPWGPRSTTLRPAAARCGPSDRTSSICGRREGRPLRHRFSLQPVRPCPETNPTRAARRGP